MEKNWRFYWRLFLSTFTLSAFTFGGGYVIVPLMRKRFVEQLKWIEDNEMLDITAISQSSPGAMAVNASILVGYRLAGIPGSFITVVGTVLPPLIILTIVSYFYFQFRDSIIVRRILNGMQAGVVAVIADVVIKMGSSIIRQKEILPILLMAAAFLVVRIFHVNVVYVLLASGLIGALRILADRRGGRPAAGKPRPEGKVGLLMILLQLFWSFFQIGLFSFGGGYAALPLIQREIVDVHHWLDLLEFADVVTISQMTPGPIAINAATFVGLRVAGLGGSIIATLGFVCPSFLIVLVLAMVYYKYRSLRLMHGIMGGLRPAVVALIASAGLTILIFAFWSGRPVSLNPSDLDLVSAGLFIASLAALQFKKSNPILVMSGAGLVGLILYSLF